MSNAVSQPLYEEGDSLSLSPWPRGVSHEAVLTIGQVVEILTGEFPAVTLSKIRYLEDQGLVAPQRTGSGYRKYSRADVERLRFILMRQRDSFAPLRVIGDELRALDAGQEVEPVPTARVVASEGRVVLPGNRPLIPARDVADLAGTDVETLERYSRLGLITPDLSGYFPSRCVQVVRLVVLLESHGVDARTLRTVRNSAERCADLIDQTVSSQRSRRRASDMEKAAARSMEFGELFGDLYQEMLRVSLSQLNEHGTKPSR
ncbi:transcriptional regulator FtsR [Schaalia sp. lx-100]|uniref:transcriptional regulator FtsR n=1 Tax=Schaalia sp. lx-100 TaxID=2899081 RepID=UPI001E4D4DBB|nr:MerR family transcriptional regulator [Schaalia sp. lx-100]MCD4557992.1 MerR family transcriptional regulator [Schaalia sp. lx-100]